MGTFRLSGWNRLRVTAVLTAASALVGALVMVVSAQVLGRHPAAKLASTLGLGSGMVLGALVGGLLGLWLVLGGAKRVAATVGFTVGIGALIAIWRIASPYSWVVAVVMNEVFGEGGDQYSGLVVFVLAIPVFRATAGAATSLTQRLIQMRRS
ncbi:MAG: hypothetical protein AB1449_14165 [Chloroflexota bacterium]